LGKEGSKSRIRMASNLMLRKRKLLEGGRHPAIPKGGGQSEKKRKVKEADEKNSKRRGISKAKPKSQHKTKNLG